MIFYDFIFDDINGKVFDVQTLVGKKVMLINTASQCGYTKQFAQLEELYKNTDRNKFEILGFPSNDFGKQDPGTNGEIAAFCEKNYGVTFPMMSKIKVAENPVHPIYSWLNREIGEEPKWNFHKYLIDEKGNVVRSIPSSTEPIDAEILDWINQ
jgi:glutathione peroxidase